MKYLKPYAIFESKTDQIRQDIEDICLEFEDCDITYSIREINYYPDEDRPKTDSLIIEIKDKHNRFFELKDVQDVIFRIREYLRDKNFLIDLSIPNEDCYMSLDSFFKEFSREELYDLDIFIYSHDRIITENWEIDQQIYNQVLDVIRECFFDFEDSGWTWIATSIPPHNISIHRLPNFNCRMMPKEDNYTPAELTDYIDMTGEISSDGEITWDTEELEFNENTSQDEKKRIEQEFNDFLTAVKRINQETGLDFNFSYNNRGGEKRIIIQGKI